MAAIIEMLDGKKTYLLMVVLLVLVTFGGGDATGLDLNALLTEPTELIKVVGVMLIGSFRSAIGKIGK